MENEVLVSVGYFEDNESISQIWLRFFPFYQVGQEIYITRMIAPEPEKSLPKLRQEYKRYIIKDIIHGIEQSFASDAPRFLTLEVHLSEL